MENYGIKELNSVSLKATYPMEFGGRQLETGETLLLFNKLQISTLEQKKTITTSQGGFHNNELIYWDNTKEARFYCSEGVFSKYGLDILSNSKLTKVEQNVKIPIQCVEEIYPVNNIIKLKNMPNGQGFIYNKDTHEKIYSNIDKQEYYADVPVIADYYYDYTNGADKLEIGHNQFNGYLRLEGKARIKDDIDGHEKTILVVFPKVRIASNLVLKLGRRLEPAISSFSFIGFPVGLKNSQKVCDILILNDDIDSDF